MVKAVNITKKAAAVVAVASLASMASFGVAHAAESASTEVQIKTESSLLSVTAPDVIVGVVNADGSITFPSSDALEIANKSVFPVNVASAETTAGECTPVAKSAYADSSAKNAMKLSIEPIGGLLKEPVAFDAGSAVDKATFLEEVNHADTGWAMAADGQEGSSINLEVSGAAKNLDINLNSPQKAFDITWTFAPGSFNGQAV